MVPVQRTRSRPNERVPCEFQPRLSHRRARAVPQERRSRPIEGHREAKRRTRYSPRLSQEDAVYLREDELADKHLLYNCPNSGSRSAAIAVGLWPFSRKAAIRGVTKPELVAPLYYSDVCGRFAGIPDRRPGRPAPRVNPCCRKKTPGPGQIDSCPTTFPLVGAKHIAGRVHPSRKRTQPAAWFEAAARVTRMAHRAGKSCARDRASSGLPHLT